MHLSKALKSILVMDVYAPGETALMKFWRESWSIMTLSTVESQINQANRPHVKTVAHHIRCSQILQQGQGGGTFL